MNKPTTIACDLTVAAPGVLPALAQDAVPPPRPAAERRPPNYWAELMPQENARPATQAYRTACPDTRLCQF